MPEEEVVIAWGNKSKGISRVHAQMEVVHRDGRIGRVIRTVGPGPMVLVMDYESRGSQNWEAHPADLRLPERYGCVCNSEPLWEGPS